MRTVSPLNSIIVEPRAREISGCRPSATRIALQLQSACRPWDILNFFYSPPPSPLPLSPANCPTSDRESIQRLRQFETPATTGKFIAREFISPMHDTTPIRSGSVGLRLIDARTQNRANHVRKRIARKSISIPYLLRPENSLPRVEKTKSPPRRLINCLAGRNARRSAARIFICLRGTLLYT